MCGHGTIGMVTVALEKGLVTPRTKDGWGSRCRPGWSKSSYGRDNMGRVVDVRIRNIASFHYASGIAIEVPGFGPAHRRCRLWRQFLRHCRAASLVTAIDEFGAASRIQQLSPMVRRLMREKYTFQHPEFPTINGVRHVMWTGKPKHPEADARNAVFYGEKAIDRSPCGTGTSARMAQLAATGQACCGRRLRPRKHHRQLVPGRVEAEAKVGSFQGIVPSIAGQAWITGYNTIFLDDRDPFVKGFTVM